MQKGTKEPVPVLEELSPAARAWADETLKAHPELTGAGHVLVVEAARARATIAAAEQALAKDGYLINGLHGPVQHPAVAMARTARAMLLRLLITLDLEG
jgi:hypothetical protein